MGHANLSNISEHFIKKLNEMGNLSIAACVTSLVGGGETVHASEGEYEDEFMLGFALEEVVGFLLDRQIIRPLCVNVLEESVVEEFEENGSCWEDEERMQTFDRVQWQISPEWADREIPLLTHHSN